MGKWASPEIIAGALDGRAGATDELIEAIWPACYRLAMMVTGDRGLAEDAAQEACVLIHRKVRSVRRVDAFDAWLYRVLMREASRIARRRGRVAEQSDGALFINETLSLDVWRALSQLSQELRDVTVLFYFDDLSGEEIAAALAISHAAVRTRLSRARERLRTLLGDYEFKPVPMQREMHQYAV